MADQLVHEEIDDYGAGSDLKHVSEDGGIEEAVSSATTMSETVIARTGAPKEDDDYDMVDHQDAIEEGSGEDASALEETYEGEHGYTEYEMADVDMEHSADQTGYAENIASTDSGSILATQENAEHQMIEDVEENGAGVAEDPETIDQQQPAGYEEYTHDEEGVMDKEHGEDEIDVDEDDQILVEDHLHPDEAVHHQDVYDEQVDQSGQIYGSNHVDAESMDYSMIASEDAANSSLAALSRVITSSVNRLTSELASESSQQQQEHEHEHEDREHDDIDRGHGVVIDHDVEQQEHQDHQKSGHDASYSEIQQELSHEDVQQHLISQSPSANSTQRKMKTPVRYKTQARRLADSEGPRSVTPIKRPTSSHSNDPSTNSRLKSKVWSWYDILPDGFRQCKFCSQKYGRLTATTILARHYHNRHDASVSPSTTPTSSRRQFARGARNFHQHRSQNQHGHGALVTSHPQLNIPDAGQTSVYSQAAAAAAAAAAVAVAANDSTSPDGQSTASPGAVSGHLFHTQGNGDATYEQNALENGSAEALLQSVSDVAQHSPYDENPLMMQGSFSSMMTAPLSRLGLTSGRSAIAAVAQFCAKNDIHKNLQTCVDLIGNAARRGAHMVFLPESSDFIAESRDQVTQLTQSVDGEFMKEIQQAAKDNAIWVSIGIHEQPPANGMPYNTNAVVSDEGVLVSIYRKLHMFDVNVKEGPRLLESSVTSRGDRIADIIDTPIGKLGSSVCYDMRFPELAQALRQRGAQLLSYPSAFTEVTGAAHWELLLRARAVETQTYVFAAAQIGKHNSKRTSYGDAMIVDPWGSVVARCSRNSNEPMLATAEINLEFLDKVRREMPVFNHKRADIFAEYVA
ncbi:Carbon-nitrogen hydrolase [Coemansia spiralis]|uniref:Carbon-nitrogen hydrolase n=1 Tax=Coemansia spiralis TaxID=417178 RepID=A0A9W8G912_9FUNG|nr:Carbon-nitrogen hydrolase [Coemansia spiralis]